MSLKASITKTKIWSELKPYVHIEEYKREGGGSSNPRIRIEFKELPHDLCERALKLRVLCVSCMTPIHPVRSRRPPGNKRSPDPDKEAKKRQNLYFAATCPLDQSIGCSRGNAPRVEYSCIKRSVGS